MAVTTVQSNNKLIKFTKEINREWVRGNAFGPYMGASLNSIIRIRNELKSGGEQMNIPLVSRLTGKGKGSGTLVGNEDKIDNYGMRVWIDWARNAVVTNKADQQKDSADIFGEAKPLLSDWLDELKRDEIIAALMALPSESSPANLGSEDGDRVNGIRYEDATATQRNTWNADNSDRVLYGNSTTNYNATHSTALSALDVTNDKFTASNASLLKRIAKNANPKIRPYKLSDGREYFVAFAVVEGGNDLKPTSNHNGSCRQSADNHGCAALKICDPLADHIDHAFITEISCRNCIVESASHGDFPCPKMEMGGP